MRNKRVLKKMEKKKTLLLRIGKKIKISGTYKEASWIREFSTHRHSEEKYGRG